MRIGLVCPLDPSPTGRGVAETEYATKKGFEDAGHEVVVNDLDCKPDVWYAYSMAAFQRIVAKPEPKALALVDLEHLLRVYTRQYYHPDIPISYPDLVGMHNVVQHTKDRLKGLMIQADLIIEHAAHHSEWLNTQGIESIYVPMPIVDPGVPLMILPHDNVPMRILMVGHVHGIATLSGLYYLEQEILPLMETCMRPEEWQIQICGGDELNERLARRFKLYHPNVILRGYVTNISAEFYKADLLLVPTPIELGMRTRIADAFAHGCLVVAHTANNHGMPEMVHGVNALVASDGKTIVDEIMRVNAWPGDMVGIRHNARDTFNKYFDHRVSMPTIVRLVEDLVGRS